MFCLATPGVKRYPSALSGVAVVVCAFVQLAVLQLSQNGAGALRSSKRGGRGQCNQSSDYCSPMAAIATVTSVTATSATVNWTYVEQPTFLDRGEVGQVRLQLREVGPDSEAGWLTRSTLSGTKRSHTLTNLKPGRVYRLRLVTINEHGVNREGKRLGRGPVQFQTIEDLVLSCTPKQQAVRVGESAEFRCQATGGPNLAISTRLTTSAAVEQRRWGSSQQFIITFRNVRKSQDETTYCVYARTTNRNATSCFQILIQEPIRVKCLKVNPCGRRVSALSRLKIRCNVYGYPLPNVTWYFNGEPVTNTRKKKRGWRLLQKKFLRSRHNEGAGFQHRIFADSTRHNLHSGQLTLVARNQLGEQRRSQDVVITDTRSRAVIRVPSQDVESGKSLTIECHANIGQTGLQFRWYHKPRGSQEYVLLDPDTPGILQTHSGRHHRLFVPQANSSHSGNYRCEATNSQQCRRVAKATVTVKAPLYVTIVKTNGWQLLQQSKPAVIDCHIRSVINNRVPMVYWVVNGNVVTPTSLSRSSWRASAQPMENAMNRSGRALFQLKTDSLKPQDLGLIRCVAHGEDGFTQEDSVNVISQGIVQVTTDPARSRQVRFGRQVRVVCHIFTDSSPNLNHNLRHAAWLHRPLASFIRAKLKPVANEAGVEVTRQLMSESSQGTYQQLILDINNFSSDKVGVYVCRVPGSWDYRNHRMKPPKLPHASLRLLLKDHQVSQRKKETMIIL